MASAGQEFDKNRNELCIDLHSCSTGYASELFDIKVEEAYKYGVSTVEFIYGTPDSSEGSIAEAFDTIRKEGHELVRDFNKGYAGVTVSIKENSNPEPRDEDMCFSPLEPEYDKIFWRQYDYLYPLYPYRMIYTTEEISKRLDCSQELVRDIAKKGFEGEIVPDARLRTVYDEYTKHNYTTWYLTNRSLRKIEEIWKKISDQYKQVLQQNGASDEEIREVLKKIRSIPSQNTAKSAKMALTKVRNVKTK